MLILPELRTAKLSYISSPRLNTYIDDTRGKIAILLEIRRRLDVSCLLPQMLPLGLRKKAVPF